MPNNPTFIIHLHDNDGYPYEKGIYLYFGNFILKIGETPKDFDDFIDSLKSMRSEVYEAYNGQESNH